MVKEKDLPLLTLHTLLQVPELEGVLQQGDRPLSIRREWMRLHTISNKKN